MADFNRRETIVNAIRRVVAFVRGNDFGNEPIQAVEHQLRNLERNFAEYLQVHDRLIGIDNIQQNLLDAHEQLRANIQDQYDECAVALQVRADAIRQANQPVPAVQQNVAPQQIQIEGIQQLIAQRVENTWGEFDGTLWKWASFRSILF